MTALGRALACSVAVLGAACSGSEPDPIDALDANVIVGDGSIPQDLGPRDMGPMPVDMGPPDTGSIDLGDAGTDFDGPPPPLDMGPPDAGDVCLEPAEATLTAQEALARQQEFAGRIVEIVATATVGAPTCTDRACPPEDPCCNECTASLLLDPNLEVVESECSEAGCSGDECALVCRPPVLGLQGSFRGRLTVTSSRARLELFSSTP